MRDLLQNTKTVLFRSIKVMAAKKDSNFHRLKVSKGMCGLNITWSPGLDPGTEQGKEVESIDTCSVVNSLYEY